MNDSLVLRIGFEGGVGVWVVYSERVFWDGAVVEVEEREGLWM